MSIDQIIPLAVIVGAFVLFAVVLAWKDYRTQQAMALKKDDKRISRGCPRFRIRSAVLHCANSGRRARRPRYGQTRPCHPL